MLLLKEQEITSQRRFEGWDVRCIDGKKNPKHEVESAFDVGMFDTDPVLVVLRNPSKVKNLKGLLDTQGLDALVIQEGDNLKVLSGYPSHEFKLLKGDKRRKAAVLFLQQEVEKHNRSIQEDLAEAVVKRVGMDFGVLRWEALKYGYCGEGALTPQEVKGLIAPLSEAEGLGIIDAIGERNVRAYLSESARVKTTKSGDPTKPLCSGLLTRNLLIWTETLARMEKGQSAQEIAQALKMNPYVVQKAIMPQAKSLGKRRIYGLLSATAKAEESVLKGAISPWDLLKSRVLGVLLG